MNTKSHIYLLALEIAPIEVGGAYHELPLHCTLMHRFYGELGPREFAKKLQPMFDATPQFELQVGSRLLLGPKQVAVYEFEPSETLSNLHEKLYKFLNKMNTEYTAPEWVGTGYKAHATERADRALYAHEILPIKAVYLIEVKVPGFVGQRLVRARFSLK